MSKINNESKDDIVPTKFEKALSTFRKLLHSTAVTTLLLPSLLTISVSAEEILAEEPPTEEVVPIEKETTDEEIVEETAPVEVEAAPEEEPVVEEPNPEDEIPEEAPAEEISEEETPSKETVVEEEIPVVSETPEEVTLEEPTATTEEIAVSTPTNLQLTQELGDPQVVRVLMNVREPNNMQNYTKSLEDFTNYPLILTNQVTGEVFRTTVVPKETNTSNNFQLEASVHNYERGNQPSGKYTITLPQELIDLGYSLSRDHDVQANQGIVGMTSISYNAPQTSQNVGQLQRNFNDYGFFDRQEVSILLTSLDGIRSYVLGSSNINIPAGHYTITVTSPTTSRPNLVWRASSLNNASEIEIPLTRQGEVYVGTISLDFTNSTRAQVLKVSPITLNTVTIDPNGGTINDEHAVTEVSIGDTYTVPYTFSSGLARSGYTLTGYSVEGTLLDANDNPVTELSRFTGTYTPVGDVTLTANWEVTSGGFRILLYDDIPSAQTNKYTVTLVAEDGTEYALSSRSYSRDHRTWTVDDVPNGTYTLVIDGYNISDFEKFGQSDTTSDFVVNENGTATVDLTFVDDKSTTFIRYRVYGEEVEAYPLGIEVRGLDGRRTDNATIYVQNEDFVVFEGSYNEYLQWSTNEELPVGTYTITLQTPSGTYAVVNDSVSTQAAVPTDRENVFTIDVNEETLGNLSAVYGAFQLVEREYRLGVEVRGLDGRRTEDVTIYVQDDDFVVFEGSFNEYSQWLTTEELPAGEYTITLVTPENTFAVINDSTRQFAMPTDEDNVFTIHLNDENLGSSSAIYGAFRLVEREYQLGVEVRDLNNRRTDEVGIVVTNEADEIFEGSFNEYLQWLTNEELPAGTYTITLTTPDGTTAEINDTVATQAAVATDEENVFTIELNDETLGNLSAIYGAFRLVEDIEAYPLGVEVRDLNNRRTSDITVVVENADGTVFEGTFDQYNLWTSNEELPIGSYTITLTTPEGTIAEINDTVASQAAIATEEENVFTIEINEETLGNLTRVFGAFRLVETPDEMAPAFIAYEFIDEEGNLVGENSQYSPVGVIGETFTFPATSIVIPEGYQLVPGQSFGERLTVEYGNRENYPTITVYVQAIEDDDPEEVESYFLGVEVRDLNNRRTDEVGIVVTNADGEIFEGSFNEYLQWLTDEELPVGTYTITLTTPEGTVAVINDTAASQVAVATDVENVFTIEVNAESLGNLSAVYGAFVLVESTDDNGDDDETETPDDNGDDDNDDVDTETPDDNGDEDETKKSTDPKKPEDKKDKDDLPKAGVTGSTVGLGIATILSGLGLAFFDRKRKK